MDTTQPQTLLATDALGIYIPHHFADMVAENPERWDYIHKADLDILRSGPDAEDYWEAWDAVLAGAEYIPLGWEANGFRLYQDGDLWLVHPAAEWSDETESYRFPA